MFVVFLFFKQKTAYEMRISDWSSDVCSSDLTRGVEGAADDLVSHTRQVLHTTAAHEHDRVLLEVVALTGDVGRDLLAARQAHAGDLAEGGVRLLRGVGEHARAHAATLRRALEGGRLCLGRLGLPALAAQLLDGGHADLLCGRRTGETGGGGNPGARECRGSTLRVHHRDRQTV